jgi:2-polyprenyl-3-methyl-5-hydroxy-6-metoxy-1,4-benzoquinol methylase
MPRPYIVNAVLRAVRAIPDYRRLRLIDLSCGRGEILTALHGDGCCVEGTHYKSGDYILHNIPALPANLKIHPDVSLDEALPFPAESYDIVLLTEVIEHLPNHFKSLGEIARIVRPGGYLILTTPNIARLHSRISFFFTGAHKLVRRRIGWDIDLSRLYEYHINPLDFTILHALARMLGLEIEAVRSTKIKKRHLYLVLLYPLVWLAALREYCFPLSNTPFSRGERDLFRHMTGFPLLFSEQLLVVLRKQ